MSDKMALSRDSEVRAAKHSGKSGDTEFRITGAPNLILAVGRLRADGTSARKWIFTRFAGAGAGRKRQRVKIGLYPHMGLKAAREAAARLSVGIIEGKPLAVATGDGTLAEMVDDYLHAQRHLKRIEERARELRKDALPALGAKKANEITPGDIDLVVTDIFERDAPAMAYRMVENFKAIYNYVIFDAPALGEKYGVKTNPADRLGRRRRGGGARVRRNKPRERFLSDFEIVQFWAALDRSAMTPLTKVALRLILVTGQRPGEVGTVDRSQLALDDAVPTWRFITSKTGKPQVVPLPAMAVELFQEALCLGSSKFLFTSPTSLRRPIGKVVLPTAMGNLFKTHLSDIPRATPHDLRRTCATGMQRIGVSDSAIEALLNHAPQGVTREVYARDDRFVPKRQALKAWQDHLCEILKPLETRGF